ncbi:glutathione S-transferase family protein [Bradyrhizobium prioriisuperbiae]|uniref:glutathione S-transferase family protein n=1 Tax=Bradyrhizobium prioriisuperbiae TaxID=2854389 RepID=UPI0028E88AB2|nr:glutathione S-transferase family protein [Bradyrhizobium prioritasuperba]
MTQLTIIGSEKSRTMRVLWMAAELGLEFRHIPWGIEDDALRDDRFLRINPNGRVPAIIDGSFSLWESLAINMYLAKKYGTVSDDSAPLYPRSLEGEALAWQWTLWAMAELEKPLEAIRFHRSLQSADCNEAAAIAAIRELDRPMAALESVLIHQEYLLGRDFSVADINVAGVLSPSRIIELPTDRYPAIQAWTRRCHGRDAAVRVRRNGGRHDAPRSFHRK